MRVATGTVVGITGLMIACLFAPCARVPRRAPSPKPPAYETLAVLGTLTRSITMPHARYLLAIPVVAAAFSAVLLLWPTLPCRGIGALSLACFAFAALPNVPIPSVWPGGVGFWHLRLVFWGFLTGLETEILWGFYAYAGLIAVLALAWLCLGIASLKARPPALAA
ncbi:MAG TPA: hypothetical protein VNE39_07815 [Planctomycetota bacterium]|nr:hypothetical protein [Planctomycetota bacterium]